MHMPYISACMYVAIYYVLAAQEGMSPVRMECILYVKHAKQSIPQAMQCCCLYSVISSCGVHILILVRIGGLLHQHATCIGSVDIQLT